MVVVEINQRSLNPTDDAYDSVAPAVAEISQRRSSAPSFAKIVNILFPLYALRKDIRQTFLDRKDDRPVVRDRPLIADDFEGTYDLTHLSDRNVGVSFLNATYSVLHAAKIPVIAFTTPTNHALLGAYIDDPAYAQNDRFLIAQARKYHATTLDLDRAFSKQAFIDNDHLNAHGNELLADVLSIVIAKTLCRRDVDHSCPQGTLQKR